MAKVRRGAAWVAVILSVLMLGLIPLWAAEGNALMSQLPPTQALVGAMIVIVVTRSLRFWVKREMRSIRAYL